MFRLVNVGGRPALEHAGGFYDVARLAGDDSLATSTACLARFEELHELTRRCDGVEPDGRIDKVVLGPPVPDARQVFGIGLNYKSHAEESGMELPPAPLTFTKFPSCLAGPTADVPLSGAVVDYEAELVVVIGCTCRDVSEDAAWDMVAGVTAGQDISDREVQLTGSPPQFCLGKSFGAYGPTGPPSSRSTPSRTLMPSSCAARYGAKSSRSPRRSSSSSECPSWSRTSPRSARSRPATSSSPGLPTVWAWGVDVSSPPETRS